MVCDGLSITRTDEAHTWCCLVSLIDQLIASPHQHVVLLGRATSKNFNVVAAIVGLAYPIMCILVLDSKHKAI